MSTSLFCNTPTVTVLDNRGLTVRDLAYYRHPDAPEVTSERITRHQYDVRGFLIQSSDPRLYTTGLANFSYLTDLAGNVLRTQGVDNGITVALNDAADRPSMTVSNICTADDGTEDLSQAVTRTWQYENTGLPGRPVSVTEQVTGEDARITDRFVYAGNSAEETSLNLAGQCVSHYDTAGLIQTDSIALTGVPLSVTRRLLKDADNPDSVADWQDDAAAWNDMLDDEAYTTLTTTDATGAMLTTTDAQGNMQRVAYDVAGLQSGSWLTLKDGAEQVIVQSLTYSAARQKLRELHGNGVVTTYEYEAETQRLTGIKTERPAGHAAGAKVLQDLRYKYDPVGNVLKVSNDAEETRFWHNQKVVPENRYTYDSLYQLVRATGREMANASQQGINLPSVTIPLPVDSSAYTNYIRTYTYDSAGNLTQIRHFPATGSGYTTRITVSDRSNRGVLSTLTENPSEVDALFTTGGQQKQLQPGQNLVWTPRNELMKVTPVVRDGSTDDQESYRYDGSSQRLLKVSVQKTKTDTQTQRVMYLPGLELRTTVSGGKETENLEVITSGEAGRAQVRVLHWTSDSRPAEIPGDQTRYSYDNLTGSSCLELDGDGNVITMEEFYPYGGTAVWTASSAVEADYKTVRYSGKERDATGLYYYGYRYYQPWVGRWLSADPAGTEDGLNLFRMCRNNPVTHTDQDGRMTDTDEYVDFHIQLAAAILNVNPSDIGAPEALVTPLPDSPSPESTFDEEHGPITDADRQPYRDLELQYSDLFNNKHIINVPESEVLTLNNVIDVDMDKIRVINASQTGMYLGTTGLGPCIAIGGIGYTSDNQTILGLTHFTGIEEPEDVMGNLDDDMRAAGARHIGYVMVGGNITPGGEESGSLGSERSLLSLRDTYNILSVRLHTSEGEFDPVTGESTAVDAVLTTTHMLFRKAALYNPYQ